MRLLAAVAMVEESNMAVFGPIPLQAGFTSMGELADLMMNKRKMQQERLLEEMKNAQRAKEAAEHAKYQQGMLRISQSAENRALKLQPYELAKLQAENAANQRFLAAQGLGGRGSSSTGPSPTDTSMLDQMIQSGNPNQPSRMPGSAPRIGTPPAIVSQNPDMDYQQRVAQNQNMPNPYSPTPSMNQQPGISPIAQAAAVTPQAGMPNQSQGSPPPQGSPFAQMQERLNNGEEVLIRGPLPGKNPALNEYAGQTRLGIKVPDLKTREVDGIQYTTYPDGSVRAYKIGPSYEEKEQMKLDTAQTKLQAASNIKASDKAEDNGKIASKSASYIKTMVDEFINDPKLTSAWYSVPIAGPIAAKAGGKGLGRFDAAAAQYQAEAAKLASTRGGIGIVNFMKTTKPDRENSPERNVGMIIANAEKVQQIYNDEKSEWERKNPGKKYPIDDPKVLEYAQRLLNKDTVTIIDPSGKEHVILRNHLDAALAKHPGTRVKGE